MKDVPKLMSETHTQDFRKYRTLHIPSLNHFHGTKTNLTYRDIWLQNDSHMNSFEKYKIPRFYTLLQNLIYFLLHVYKLFKNTIHPIKNISSWG